MYFGAFCEWRGVELQEFLLLAIHLHHRCFITAAVAVVGCRPQCHKGTVSEVVDVSLLHQLMRSHDSLQSVHPQELGHYFPTEEKASATVVQGPSLVIGGIGVAPDQVAHGS